MKKNNAILIIPIFIMILFILIPTISSAKFYNFFSAGSVDNIPSKASEMNVGDRVYVNVIPDDGLLRLAIRNEVLCIQQGQHFYNDTTVQVIKKVVISGKNCDITKLVVSDDGTTKTNTVSVKNKTENLVMSYILAIDDESYYPNANLGGNKRYLNNHDPQAECYIHQKTGLCYSPKQLAVYKYFNKWSSAIGLGVSGTGGDTLKPSGDHTQEDVDDLNAEAEEIVSDAETYANNYKEQSNATITRENTTIKTETYSDGKNNYVKVGPIKLTYTGSINKYKVYNQSNDEVTVKYGKVGSDGKLTLSDNLNEVCTSGKEFYILIDTSKNITKISKFNVGVKSVSSDKYTTNVWVFSNGVTTDNEGNKKTPNKYANTAAQNLIYAQSSKVNGNETTAEITIENIQLLGNLTINKVDKDTKKTLANVGFTVKAKTGTNKGKYVSMDSSGNAVYNTEPVTLKTNSNGQIEIKALELATYEIEEVINPNYGYESAVGTIEEVTVNGANVTFEFPNEQKIGNLKIIKVDADDPNYKLENVKFILQKDGKYIIYDKTSKKITGYTTNKEEATEFITDGNGEILIENLISGKYTLIEIENPHYGYELTTKDVTVGIKNTITDIVSNKQKYIKLSGYVWEDFIQDDKVSTKNNLFHDGTSDVNDKLLNGITVRLKDSSGKVIQETKTQKLDIYTTNGNDGNGEYRFEDVEKDKLGDYYIEFEYDGLVYTNVSPNINLNNGSKSIESTTKRESFNKGFSTVRGEKNQSSSIGVGYTTDSPDSDKGNKVYDLTYKLSNHTATLENDGKTFIIVANTTDAGYNLDSQHIAGQEEIQYINLGIYKRSQPQLVVRKEIENVKLGINDFEHTYVYENRFDNQEIKTEFQQSGYGVKFGEKYLNTKYSLPVYNSDYTTELEDKTKELKVYITYKIEIVNQSGDLYSQVNSIVDYYDDQCTIVKAGTTLDNTGNIGNVLETKNVTDKNFNGYNSTRILTQSKIAPNKSQEIYVQFELSREKVKDIIEYNESNISQKELVDNVAEIYEYSTYDENGKIYAGIDKSSNPANTEPGNTDTFELDTDRAPGLLLEDGGDRQVTGIVFEDSNGTKDELEKGKTRQGNGHYENNEPKIKDVKVTLKDKNGTERGTATTNENGEYTISKFIPGEYNIVFSWGNGDKYIVEDYKGTVYDKTRYDTNSSNLYWYKEDSEKQKRYSDAVDDYDNIVTNIPKNNIKPSGIIMNSTTPNFKVDIETDTSVGSGTYKIENMDFGIIEKARQAVEIHKNVSELKITLANGQTIVDAKMEDGKLLEPVPWVKFEGKKLWVEMESELIQGSQLNLKYDMSIDNKSEIDYITKDYYLYGIPGTEDDKAKIEIEKVYDYIDSEFMLNNEENGDWTEISENEYNTVENTTLTIQELWNREYIITDNSITKNESVDYSQLSDWEDEAKISRNEYFKDKAILATDSFDGKLKPGESTIDSIGVVNLTASKILGGNDEVDLNNEVEITKIVKDSTRKITPFESVVKAKAESTTVTPPTGENRSYIIPVIISISVLIVLGAGIILIKKKII